MMKQHNAEKQNLRRRGFTLVELAIVIVIIGLIVGGVLVGQDMINAAEIRSTIAQIQSYDTAKNTFKDKYGQLPGDGTTLGDFGFTGGNGNAGHSDGNGRLEGCSAGATVLGCENAVYWLNLSESNLIGFAPDFAATGAALDEDTPFANATDSEENYLPEVRVGTGNFIHAHVINGINNYFLAAITNAQTMAANDALSPIQSENIDRKMDDGLPHAGTVVSVDAIGTTTMTTATDNGSDDDCTVGVTRSSAYNTATQAESDAVSCQLRIRMN